MKKSIFAFAAFAIFSLSFSACTRSCKEVGTQKAQVIRNCTGTYLRVEDKDYLVCNLNLLTQYADNEQIEIGIHHIAECPDLNNKTICMMVYPNAGIVEVVPAKE
jgi:hypothetical protein